MGLEGGNQWTGHPDPLIADLTTLSAGPCENRGAYFKSIQCRATWKRNCHCAMRSHRTQFALFCWTGRHVYAFASAWIADIIRIFCNSCTKTDSTIVGHPADKYRQQHCIMRFKSETRSIFFTWGYKIRSIFMNLSWLNINIRLVPSRNTRESGINYTFIIPCTTCFGSYWAIIGWWYLYI
jgi:hypothetical protein